MKRTRSYSHYTAQALHLLGMLIRTQRIERRTTARELAERAGISRDLLHRIEKGDPRCEIGVVFEVAAIVGVPLFEPDEADLKRQTRHATEKLALLPKAVHPHSTELKDDF